jgi:alpha-beta hydrolase superfamily lysophospholipase
MSMRCSLASPADPARMGAPDILGQGFSVETLYLDPVGKERVVATLVSRPCSQPSERALLYVHGYNDYFFQVPLADAANQAGWSFYALDLRRCGRSWRPGQLLAYTTDLKEYYEELDAAVACIRERDGHRQLALLGHSTGGLTSSLYAHDRGHRGEIDALILNAPFFSFRSAAPARPLLEKAVLHLGRFAPRSALPLPAVPFLAWSLHRSFGRGGEWSYNLEWKRPGTLPLRIGWLRAAHLGHERVRAGLEIRCPVLCLISARSGGGPRYGPEYSSTDVVLDVQEVARRARRIGQDLRVEAIEGALHDVMLSRAPLREEACARLFHWLDGPSFGRDHVGA